MQPSETERGRRWLSNFERNDRPFANLLLDNLYFVNQDELRSGLQLLIEGLVTKISAPIALIPVRQLAPGQSYYKSSNRNARAPLLLSSSFPGSEAIIANIAGALRRRGKNAGPFVASPSLKNLRDARARTILFIDDFSGSGNRLITFQQQYRDHPTIRSWESYGLITYHTATYAMTRVAYDRLSKTFGSDHVHVVRMCPTLSQQDWTSDELRNVERICREYTLRSDFALGYDDSRGLMAFSHSAPNNLPAILWQPHFRAHWNPFFVDRAVPSELMPLFEEEESTYEMRLASSLHHLGQSRLAEGGWRNEASPELKNALLVLAAIARRPRDDVRIAELTGLPHREIAVIVANCRDWKLVGSRGLRLTDEGQAELQHAKGILLTEEKAILKGSHKFYYPRSLRVGR